MSGTYFSGLFPGGGADMKNAMIRITALALACAVAAGAAAFGTAAGNRFLGDVDGNEKIDAADALAVLRCSVGLEDRIDRDTADINRDGKINSGDALLILQTAVGLVQPVTLTSATTEGKKTTTTTTTTTTKTTPVDYTVSYSSTGRTIKTKNGVTYIDGVLIVNKTYSLPAGYNPGGLTPECQKAFNKMSAAASREGLSLWVASGFRSYDLQSRLYNNYVAQDGRAAADTYSARPGHSEHQTGLAIDLNSIDDSFAYTAEGKWVAKNCYKYGFIIRYPKGKESKTGYMYEPWHIRYVGDYAAEKIYNSGLCLEEYFGITSRY